MDNNPNGNKGHPVQTYTSEEQGLEANVTTILNPRYGGIVSALKANDQLGASEALVDSPWGTHIITDPETKQKVTGTGKPGTSVETGGPSYQPLIPSSITQAKLPSALSWLPNNFLVRGGEIAAGSVLMLVGVIAVAETLGASGVAKAALDTAGSVLPQAKAAKLIDKVKGSPPPK